MSQWVDTPLLITTPRTKPPTPQRGGNTQDPHSENPPPQDGKGVIDNQYCG